MSLHSASIFHNLQNNRYYRVDKLTGEMNLAYKNGELLKQFKVNITGTDYKLRKIIQLRNQTLGNRENRPLQRKTNIQAISLSKLSQSNYHKTGRLNQIDCLKNKHVLKNKLQERSIFKNTQQERSVTKIMKSESDSNFITSFANSHINEATQNFLFEKKKIHQIMTQYSKINDAKIYSNHSPFHKDSGVVVEDKRGFRETKLELFKPSLVDSKKIFKHKSVGKTIKNIQTEADQFKCWNRQVSKEKRLFLDLHPELKSKENPKILNDQKQRKINFKQLQKLFLEQTSKITNQIYE